MDLNTKVISLRKFKRTLPSKNCETAFAGKWRKDFNEEFYDLACHLQSSLVLLIIRIKVFIRINHK